MSSLPTQLALPLETHRNHYLFSDYYLNTLLPRQSSWREADAEAAQALEALHQLHADKRALLRPALSESALEDEWIRPILDLLGHTYHVGAALPSPEGSRTPDYALFPDEATRRATLPHLGTAEFYGTALAVADAKRWDRSLDRRLTDGAGDAFSNANPSYQIDYYLRITGRDWGLLTNGRLWRLYHHESSFRLDSYYEVDLVNLLEQGQIEHFKYFYLFFRRVAFPQFLDQVLRESREYAQGISEDLKERVYEALRLLAEGFLKYPGTSLTPADLKEVHDNALILLYRLLFIFYAESRRLLPLENRSYAEVYSLKAVKEDIADKLDRSVPYLPRWATIWDNLKAVFYIINEGSDELGIPAYNGRLFDPTKYPFLEEQTIGDAYLVQALDLLARVQGPQGLDFVDYRDLEIRHLGSIYEGLLEYQLRYADRDMAVAKDRKGERVVPAEEGQRVVFPTDSVYLVTDRGERKATGSYYTPDYIVKYIVENTLGPLVDEKQRAIQDRLTDLEARLKAARGENRELLERELARVREGFGEAVLELKVLDPAMGSGHFLVETTDYLAQRIVDFGVRLGAGAEGDEGAGETEINYWRRRVVESGIYGVDVNPLAVELAKLSLWLATTAKGKPLSFLDHHLRCGNSLIGARLEDLQALPVQKKTRRVSETLRVSEVSQLAMWDESAFTRDVSLAVGGLAAIQELASDSVEDIHQKERIFQKLLEVHLKRWRQIADLWVSAYFGNEMAPEVYADLVRRVQTGEGMLPDVQAQPYLDRTHALWREKRFFHWELEFPEVFFDQLGRPLKEQAGFDAVVGNPPYLSMEDMASDDRDYYYARDLAGQRLFETAMHKCNVYAIFWEKALRLVRRGGYSSLITPYSWLSNSSFINLRKLLLHQMAVHRLDLLPFGVFEDAGIATSTMTVQKLVATDSHSMKARDLRDFALVALPGAIAASTGFRAIPVKAFRETPDFVFNLEWDPELASILAKMEEQSRSLGSLASVDRGCDTANNEKYTGYEFRDDLNPKRLLVGEAFSRYDYSWDGLYLYYLPHQMTGEKSTARPGESARFEKGEKLIVYRFLDEARRFVGIYDDEQYYCLGSTYVVALYQEAHIQLRYVLSLLNSRLIAFYNSKLFAGVKVTRSEMLRLPIRRVAFTTPQEERERLVEEGKGLAGETVNEWATNKRMGGEGFVYSFAEFVDSPLGHWLDARLPSPPPATPPLPDRERGLGGEGEQSDVIHDLLAHLAEQMIEMHKAKSAEVRGFLDWLAGYTGLPVEEWSLKTNLKAYYQHDWAEMQRILDRNCRQIKKVDVVGREASERIRREYQASVGKLQPLLARIAATDCLIDLIVYRLYGLTEEEVAVVEGVSG